jgi:hypothetical protein
MLVLVEQRALVRSAGTLVPVEQRALARVSKPGPAVNLRVDRRRPAGTADGRFRHGRSLRDLRDPHSTVSAAQ